MITLQIAVCVACVVLCIGLVCYTIQDTWKRKSVKRCAIQDTRQPSKRYVILIQSTWRPDTMLYVDDLQEVIFLHNHTYKAQENGYRLLDVGQSDSFSYQDVTYTVVRIC